MKLGGNTVRVGNGSSRKINLDDVGFNVKSMDHKGRKSRKEKRGGDEDSGVGSVVGRSTESDEEMQRGGEGDEGREGGEEGERRREIRGCDFDESKWTGVSNEMMDVLSDMDDDLDREEEEKKKEKEDEKEQEKEQGDREGLIVRDNHQRMESISNTIKSCEERNERKNEGRGRDVKEESIEVGNEGKKDITIDYFSFSDFDNDLLALQAAKQNQTQTQAHTQIQLKAETTKPYTLQELLNMDKKIREKVEKEEEKRVAAGKKFYFCYVKQRSMHCEINLLVN